MNYEELKRSMDGQKPAMTSGERMVSYLSGKEVDFQPYLFLSADFAFANIFGYTAKQYLEDFDVTIDVLNRKRDEFDQGAFDISLGLKSMGAALGSSRVQPENGIDYIDNHILKDYADFDKLKVPDPYTNAVLGNILNRARRIRETLPNYGFSISVAGPITTSVAVRPIENILKDTVKNPEKLHQLLDFIVECNLKWIEALKAEFGPIPVSFADPAVCSNILSEKQFDNFSMPHFRKMIDGIKGIMGRYPGGHICGSSRKLWSKLADAGVMSFSIDNCEDLANAKEVFGSKMSLMGNVPPVAVMKDGCVDDVIDSVKECLKKGADNPKGFILATGCQLPIGAPRENVEAFIYAARRSGMDARLGRLPGGTSELL
jgi:uroporphyrinogen decarboxylase